MPVAVGIYLPFGSFHTNSYRWSNGSFHSIENKTKGEPDNILVEGFFYHQA